MGTAKPNTYRGAHAEREVEMQRIIDYRIVAGDNGWVSNNVALLVKEGWQPLGPLVFIRAAGERVAQAIVRYEVV